MTSNSHQIRIAFAFAGSMNRALDLIDIVLNTFKCSVKTDLKTYQVGCVLSGLELNRGHDLLPLVLALVPLQKFLIDFQIFQ